ncbi:hypothetical protein SAMN05660297_01265 [Natronincola peptidivorans]|uniref:Uncharacterized protein n=1 Tax=Natronincola peptidivorans TaxID=426128 RepID=A0A1I0BIX9_9FIRM|nr:hypothetical protein [Natronincola peptidivorans]SET06197.1 hypothetical protein SAMN05660297_01265 [Natronincola peptidivorans]
MARLKKSPALTFIIVLIVLLIVGQVVYANTKEPGSSEDPLVTLSYVEQRIEQVRFYIDEKLSSSQPGQPSGDSTKGGSLELVYLSTGERLIADAGTEIILRAGNAVAIDSHRGGLSDVTAATDIRMNQQIPPNHLIIVPREDGRGVRALTNDVILLVRGKYTIEK